MKDLSMFDNIKNPYFCFTGTEYNPKLPLAVAKIKDKWEILYERDEKTGKVKVKGVKPSKAKSEGWLTREELKEASETIQKDIAIIIYGGVACIDLDHCLDDNGEPNDFAASVLSCFKNTYIEKSRSKTGLHIFLKYTGKLLVSEQRNDIKCEEQKEKYLEQGENIIIEAYSRNKIVMFTGDSYNGLMRLEDCTEQFDRIYRKYFTQKKRPVGRPKSKDDPILIKDTKLEKIFDSITEKLRDCYKGGRNDTLVACAFEMGTLCNYITEDEAHDRLFDVWEELHPEGDASKEFESTFKRGWNKGITEPKIFNVVSPEEVSLLPNAYSDNGQAEVFIKIHGNNFRFCKGLGFLYFDSQKWMIDDSRIYESLCEMAKKQYLEAVKIQSKDYIKYALKYQNDKIIRGVINNLKNKLSIDGDELDSEKTAYLINTPEGTIDLKSGKSRDPLPEDYCTKITKYVASDHGKEEFTEFMEWYTKGDKKLECFLQEVLGQGLIGKVSHKIYWIYGLPGTGKSVLLNLAAKVLNDKESGYAYYINPDLLTSDLRDARKESAMMKLKGVRFAINSEVRLGSKLDTQKIKQLASNEKIVAKNMGQDYITFTPTHTIILSTNSLPESKRIDNAIKDRIIAIHYENDKIRDTSREIDHYEEILAEKCGGYVLKWLIDGAYRYINNGMRFTEIPKAVSEATEDYFEDNDRLKEFIEDKFVVTGGTDKVKRSRIYELYKRYYFSNPDVEHYSKNEFLNLFSQKFHCLKTNGEYYFTGLREKPRN